MYQARIEHRNVRCCPICSSDDYSVFRRMPTARSGHVRNQCLCQRCGAAFSFEEDAIGKPVPPPKWKSG